MTNQRMNASPRSASPRNGSYMGNHGEMHGIHWNFIHFHRFSHFPWSRREHHGISKQNARKPLPARRPDTSVLILHRSVRDPGRGHFGPQVGQSVRPPFWERFSCILRRIFRMPPPGPRKMTKSMEMDEISLNSMYSSQIDLSSRGIVNFRTG